MAVYIVVIQERPTMRLMSSAACAIVLSLASDLGVCGEKADEQRDAARMRELLAQTLKGSSPTQAFIGEIQSVSLSHVKDESICVVEHFPHFVIKLKVIAEHPDFPALKPKEETIAFAVHSPARSFGVDHKNFKKKKVQIIKFTSHANADKPEKLPEFTIEKLKQLVGVNSYGFVNLLVFETDDKKEPDKK